MKIYTKTGDAGQTGLFSGKRLSKADARVEAYGTVDELNAHLGLLRDLTEDEQVRQQLLEQQQHLFALGAALADDRPGQAYQLPESATPGLERAIDDMEAELPRMTHFILPGGHQTVSQAHVCRTVCRRAERRTVELANIVELDESILRYLNRLSDYFFVLSRHLTRLSGAEEIKWIS
jgi:cob(I)alamin adenosyltransferase